MRPGRGGSQRWRPRRSREWGPGLRAPPVTPRAARALSPTGSRRNSRGLAVRPASRARGRAGRLLPGQEVEERRPQGLRVGASRARRAELSAWLELPPVRCRRRCPLADSAGDCQVLWKSASGESNLLPGDL
ncbi:unnamed protein product [Rangifer tarandus platyrhynchus]|uniref:Uncharacterized protein n=2 Tax=Rangifer tarandus platyrhynchus TaxID=3082113 RepID=A0ABN8ZYA3_RANTA|nr:unnamed protein product [Rangifer tarandus platyrhynchus]CAI9712170.1 unnamed protein product [Rangifer tarandus platyrhynchus]